MCAMPSQWQTECMHSMQLCMFWGRMSLRRCGSRMYRTGIIVVRCTGFPLLQGSSSDGSHSFCSETPTLNAGLAGRAGQLGANWAGHRTAIPWRRPVSCPSPAHNSVLP
jgi:hypothetical protein